MHYHYKKSDYKVIFSLWPWHSHIKYRHCGPYTSSGLDDVSVGSDLTGEDDTLNKPIQLKVVKVQRMLQATWCKNHQRRRKPFTGEAWLQRGVGVGTPLDHPTIPPAKIPLNRNSDPSQSSGRSGNCYPQGPTADTGPGLWNQIRPYWTDVMGWCRQGHWSITKYAHLWESSSDASIWSSEIVWHEKAQPRNLGSLLFD